MPTKFWNFIPANSTLDVAIRGGDRVGFTATLTVDGTDHTLERSDFPLRRTIGAGARVRVEVRAAFTGVADTLTVQAKVTGPQGPVGAPFDDPLSVREDDRVKVSTVFANGK